MKKMTVISMLAVFAFCFPGFICAEDAMRGEVMRPTPARPTSEEPPLDYGPPTYMIPSDVKSRAISSYSPKEWHVIEEIPTAKGLVNEVLLFQEGMPIGRVQSILGKPQEIISLKLEGYDGTILVYPHHHFFFSKTGNLETIKERKL